MNFKFIKVFGTKLLSDMQNKLLNFVKLSQAKNPYENSFVVNIH